PVAMSATTAMGFGFRRRVGFLGPTFPFFRPFPSFVGHFMFRQRTQGGRPRMITLMTGWPHALHRSSVGTMRPRWGSGYELSHAMKRLPRRYRMSVRFPSVQTLHFPM